MSGVAQPVRIQNSEVHASHTLHHLHFDDVARLQFSLLLSLLLYGDLGDLQASLDVLSKDRAVMRGGTVREEGTWVAEKLLDVVRGIAGNVGDIEGGVVVAGRGVCRYPVGKGCDTGEGRGWRGRRVYDPESASECRRHRLFRVRVMLSNLIWKSEAVLAAKARAATSTFPFPPLPGAAKARSRVDHHTRSDSSMSTFADSSSVLLAVRSPPSSVAPPPAYAPGQKLTPPFRRSVSRAPQTFSSSRRTFVSPTRQKHPPDAYTGTATATATTIKCHLDERSSPLYRAAAGQLTTTLRRPPTLTAMRAGDLTTTTTATTIDADTGRRSVLR
jgi:hypothetical protein